MQAALADALELASQAVSAAVLPRLQSIVANPDLAYEKMDKQPLLERLFDDLSAATALATACAKNIDEVHKLREKLGLVQQDEGYTQALLRLLYGEQPKTS